MAKYNTNEGNPLNPKNILEERARAVFTEEQMFVRRNDGRTLTLSGRGVNVLKRKKTYEEIEREVLEHQRRLIEKGVLMDPKSIDVGGFVKYCEHEYGMETNEFHSWYEQNDFEGNSDMKFWYAFTKDTEDGKI
ncbi:hypothetical protein [Neobacillus sp. YIM B06451]|uniref:hypothetical protein n=1 Tax=Neobacillus sp. YIM B06451 TaxID=3070994 RepID=UPI00292DC85C|nr:hypothetical protein [Neobacillus sp. YIM B06451]